MKIEIEQYKGQTIEYDEDTDKFVCSITCEDRSKKATRTSLVTLRKEIDQFLKLNSDFKPFKLFSKENYSTDLHILHVEAMRTDGLFVCRIGDSTSKQFVNLSSDTVNKKRYFVYDGEVERDQKQLWEDQKAFHQSIKQKAEKLVDRLTPFDKQTVEVYLNRISK